ncbi:putative glutathione peroxidase [mine drainage metagenome]|uniref:Putative glutathione peroxidase n=1 Tax=mine drainage metagenome TaxID=410659 RepID=A0A1J5T6Y0_9ZZZZ
MKKLILFFCLTVMMKSVMAQKEFYSIKVDSIGEKKKIDFSAFKNKNVLLIICASKDSSFWQMDEAIQLKKLYNDQLEIVIIPTNDYGTEPDDDDMLFNIYNKPIYSSLIVAAKIDGKKNKENSFIDWISDDRQNGSISMHFDKAFQKILINKKGEVIGVFNKEIAPLNNIIIRSIDGNKH